MSDEQYVKLLAMIKSFMAEHGIQGVDMRFALRDMADEV